VRTVGIAAGAEGHMAKVRVLAGTDLLSTSFRPVLGSFSGGEKRPGREAGHLPHSAEVNNMWSSASTSTYAFKACYLISAAQRQRYLPILKTFWFVVTLILITLAPLLTQINQYFLVLTLRNFHYRICSIFLMSVSHNAYLPTKSKA
jgi:hypothetical protein